MIFDINTFASPRRAYLDKATYLVECFFMSVISVQCACSVTDQSWDGAGEMNNSVYSNPSSLSGHLSEKGKD